MLSERQRGKKKKKKGVTFLPGKINPDHQVEARILC